MRAAVFLAAAGAIVAAQDHSAAAPASGQSLFNELGTIEQTLSEITGLKFSKPVPYAAMDKAQLRKFLEQRIHETVKPEQIRAEETTLKMMGLVPRDFNLRQTTVDLLTEQAAAFYDFHKKKLFVLDTTPGEAERMALAHELSHALADQNFHLEKYIKEGLDNDDESMARMAVMEGQASWLMAAYMSKIATGQTALPPGVIDLMSHAIEASSSEYPVFANAPLYMKVSLIFPYAQGMRFQNVLYDKLGQASFARPFKQPPVSTQQIYEPEKYLNGVEPDPPELPDTRDKGYRVLADGTLGELDYRVLLQLYGSKDEAAALAPEIAGARYRLLERKEGGAGPGQYMLLTASRWPDAEAVHEYFAEQKNIMRARKQTAFEVAENTPAAFGGRDDYGWFRFWIEGNVLRGIQGANERLNPRNDAP